PNVSQPAARSFTSNARSAEWELDRSIVLVFNSCDAVQLHSDMTLPQGVIPRWQVIRNPDDDSRLRSAPYSSSDVLTLGQTTGFDSSISPDQTGSFSVICFVDSNNNGTYDPGVDCGAYLNLVVCKVTPVADNSSQNAHPSLSVEFKPSEQVSVNRGPLYTVDMFQWHSGTFNSAATAAMHFNASILLVGGGADGTLGTERVKSGWCQGTNAEANNGTFTHAPGVAAPEVSLFVSNDNGDNVAGAQSTYYTSTATHPAQIVPALSSDHPLLDTGRGSPEDGGINVALTTSDESESSVPDGSLGVSRTVDAIDSPGLLMLYFYSISAPNAKPPELESNSASLNFTGRLVVWTGTNQTDPSTAPSEAGANLYSVVFERPWQLSITVDRVNNPGKGVGYVTVLDPTRVDGYSVRATGPTEDGEFTFDISGSISSASSSSIQHSPAVRLSNTNGEILPPTTLQRIDTYDLH
ncbi:MAG: hypothetical protein ACRDHZ_17025, partial [Ktedonobacteraceae bacterium]